MSELIVQDFGGVNNADPHATAARLLQGGSWKQQRIVVVMPAANSIPAKVVLSWLNLGFPPNNGVVRILALGTEVGEAYSQAVAGVLAHPELSKWEYLLTLEHDNAPPPDGVVRLVDALERNPHLAAVGGLYFTKGRSGYRYGGSGGVGGEIGGGVAQIWGDPRDITTNFRPMPPDPNGGLVECCGTGMGFTLFRLAMFKDERLRRPWFVTQTRGGFATQDLYMWSDVRKYGYRCAIDSGCKVGHYDLEGKFGPPDTMY